MLTSLLVIQMSLKYPLKLILFSQYTYQKTYNDDDDYQHMNYNINNVLFF